MRCFVAYELKHNDVILHDFNLCTGSYMLNRFTMNNAGLKHWTW